MSKKSSFSSNITRLPVIGRVLRVAKGVVRLPETKQVLITETTANRERINQAEIDNKENKQQLEQLLQEMQKLQEKNSNLQHKINILSTKKVQSTSDDGRKVTLADNHLLDKFYVEFEDRFRGGEEDIYERVAFYLPRIKKLFAKAAKSDYILDIGCGRGEFLKLMKDNKIKATGLDLNSTMAEKVRKKGYEVIEQDALSYLLKQKDNSILAITGFHIVEHIPFDELLTLFSECQRVLKPGGMILFETPNPENLMIGAWKFYYDPSHLSPLPPDMLEFAVRTCGFSNTEIVRLHPDERYQNNKKSSVKNLDDAVHEQLFGNQDYSVIAYKD